jgi:hypothetical protein
MMSKMINIFSIGKTEQLEMTLGSPHLLCLYPCRGCDGFEMLRLSVALGKG